jgi:hypothetical protein
MPLVPALNAAPFSAPRPARPSQIAPAAGSPGTAGAPGPAFDPARSAQVQREFAQRVARPPSDAPARHSPIVAVLLVVLAAAAAATTVYFVLPLLT